MLAYVHGDNYRIKKKKKVIVIAAKSGSPHYVLEIISQMLKVIVSY